MDLDSLSFHQVTHRDDIAWIAIDRPDAQNALTVEAAAELRDVTGWAGTLEDIRAIVITGNGGMFCTGADLRLFEGGVRDERRLWSVARRLHAAIRNLVTAPKPVIAKVEGVAAGGGLGLALSADLVYLASDARLEFAYPRIGLSGDGGSSYLLPRLVGLRKARELALLDEPIDAATAVDLGLVTEAVDPVALDSTVEDTVDELATGPTKAYGRFKQLTWMGLDRSFDDQLRAEVEVIARLASSADYEAGINAFFEKSDPTFTGE